MVTEEARKLMATYGHRASQIVIDEIVAAIKRGDAAEAAQRGAVLRALEKIGEA